jgi:hypothetical protein
MTGATPVLHYDLMPTKRRRHAITETPPVQEALDDLREELNGERIDFGELVVLGAREKASRIRAERERTTELRWRLADEIRNGELKDLIDPEAAEYVRHHGWADREPAP